MQEAKGALSHLKYFLPRRSAQLCCIRLHLVSIIQVFRATFMHPSILLAEEVTVVWLLPSIKFRRWRERTFSPLEFTYLALNVAKYLIMALCLEAFEHDVY